MQEGFLICKVTGCCIKNISYSEMEYTENVRAEVVKRTRVPAQPNKQTPDELSWTKQYSGRGNGGRRNRYRSWVHSRLFISDREKREVREILLEHP